MKRAGRFTRFFAFIIITLMIVSFWSQAFATEQDLQERLDLINKEIQANEALLQQKKQAEQKASAELKTLNNTLSLTSRKLQTTESTLSKTERELKVLEAELQKSQATLSYDTQVLQNRLMSIYKQSNVHVLDVLLNATSITDFLTRWDLLSRLAQNDVGIINSVNKEIKVFEDKQTVVSVKKESLLKLEKDQSTQKQQLQVASSRQKELYKSIQQERAEVEKALNELEEENQKIAAEIRRITGQDVGQYLGSGKMAWPTPGYTRITSAYGYRIHPILKTKRFHTGVDIGAANKTKIVAAEQGTVIDVGYRGAYGNVVIVNHGGNIVTMYAHCSSTLVRVGDRVNRGQTVALVGSTGWSTGPHLHFEVRKNGDTVNPMSYLK